MARNGIERYVGDNVLIPVVLVPSVLWLFDQLLNVIHIHILSVFHGRLHHYSITVWHCDNV